MSKLKAEEIHEIRETYRRYNSIEKTVNSTGYSKAITFNLSVT